MRCGLILRSACGLMLAAAAVWAEEEPLFTKPVNVNVPHISTDGAVNYDYDIVYVRAQRAGDMKHKRFYTDFSQPVTMEPGADLMLLHPDGSEELLVGGSEGSITDPVVSFDAQWVYYTHLYNLQQRDQWSPPKQGADIFKIHVKSRKIVRLTDQRFYPNTGAAQWTADYRTPEEGKTYFDYGVFNMGACPLPGGRVAFTSNRDGFRPAKGYPAICLQLFVMDDSDEGLGRNVEKIGHMNLAGALHPVVLADGRIMFSTLESQGLRSDISWGIWTIHPDGTNWGPLMSAFDPGGASNGFHFQAQRSDGSIIIEQYYNQNNSGFGSYIKLPPQPPEGYAQFGPASMSHERNKPWRFGRNDNGRGRYYRMPFMPTGSTSFTPFALNQEGPADPSVIGDSNSPKVGKFTHPSAAPDNGLLTVYSPGPVNHQYTFLPQLDGGIYLIKRTEELNEPAEMRLIKSDPNFNESWPRAVVSYQRVFGIDEPKQIAPLANDGKLSKHLPEGTPFGLVGTSSLYKRESYPNGAVPKGSVTSTFNGENKNDSWRGLDAFTSHGNGMPLNWHNQGGDVGLYDNADIHAIRILAMEPTTDRHRGPNSGRRFFNFAHERLRILGEIPVRKFAEDKQPLDPDGNPDTSFLARIPADTAFTFQTIDKDGMVLNMAQTWHQLRPGEIRTNCGGCHAHSQEPTDFALTAAAKDDYRVWDLANETPLVVDKPRDKSGSKWSDADDAGLVTGKGPYNVEYFRDVQPILERSCVACHTKQSTSPPGKLVLDADDEKVGREHHGQFPGTYARLAMDEKAEFGYKPVGYDSFGYPQASRYIRKMQSRRSLLVWKLFGKRLDGFSNDDHPSETPPGSGQVSQAGKPVEIEKVRHAIDLDFTGSIMPPQEAIDGTYKTPDGRTVKVPPLSDEDRRTMVRWIDLGCPIDFDYDPKNPDARGYGWMCDDNRPVLSITTPHVGANETLDRIVIGMFDYGTGLDAGSFGVTSTVAINGKKPGENLASLLKSTSQGVWELKLDEPVKAQSEATLTVAMRDVQGNLSQIVRVFSVGGKAEPQAQLPPKPFKNDREARADRTPFPAKVHVFEDFETEIERRWWLRGQEETRDLAASQSASIANRRALRAGDTKDFDDLMGDLSRPYKAAIFNPVPGPPMGNRTHLRFRYQLSGTSQIRVQLYSLTNNYHRRIVLDGLPRDRWETTTLDLTAMRRPDGSGGPLSADERIDDIQFYIEPSAELLIDDIVLFDAAADATEEPFPARIIFTGWFDTGKQGAEWPGEFEIVTHEKPRTWKAARSITPADGGAPRLRVGLRGQRSLSTSTALRFQHRLTGATSLSVSLLNTATGEHVEQELTGFTPDQWTPAKLEFSGKLPATVDQIRFDLPKEATLLVDDLLLYEPALR